MALNALVGCCVGNVIINHLLYADDLVILAPSVAGLSKLLSICGIFGESNDIIFNQKKSSSLYFISKMLKGAFTFTFLGPPDFGQSRHVCSWLTCCRWLFVAVV